MKTKLFISTINFLLLTAFLIPLNVELAQAQTSTPTIWVKIYRIQAVDPIEGLLEDGADWRYTIYIWNGDDWSSIEYKPDSNNDDIIVNISHKFEDIKITTTTILIELFEDDIFGAYEIADISSREDVSRFSVTYNLKDNTLNGDEVIVEGGYYKTSGDYDDSIDVDENDANLWFDIWDNYDPPQANAGSDQTAYRYDKVNFDGSLSTASSGSSLVKYQWDFENDDIFDAEGEKASYTYTKGDEYTVVLKVIDNLGESDTDIITITVINRDPEANFSYSPTSPTEDEDVQFTDESTDPEGKQLSYSWDFDDGYTSTQKNPTHKYESAGTYTVKLTVTDDEGATDTISQTIAIKEKSFFEQPVTGQPGGIPLWVILAIIIALVGVVVGVVVIKKGKPT